MLAAGVTRPTTRQVGNGSLRAVIIGFPAG